MKISLYCVNHINFTGKRDTAYYNDPDHYPPCLSATEPDACVGSVEKSSSDLKRELDIMYARRADLERLIAKNDKAKGSLEILLRMLNRNIQNIK